MTRAYLTGELFDSVWNITQQRRKANLVALCADLVASMVDHSMIQLKRSDSLGVRVALLSKTPRIELYRLLRQLEKEDEDRFHM